MKQTNTLVGIYDFELFPYALGDVLTWNVRTAMRCEELGRKLVDIYICVDRKYPAGIYQRGLVNPDNFELFFSELYGAFGTHPCLGNIFIFRERESMIASLVERASRDSACAEALADYRGVLGLSNTEGVVNGWRRRLANLGRGSGLVRAVVNRLMPAPLGDAIKRAVLPNEEALNQYFIKYIHSHEAINEFAKQRGRIPYLNSALGCSADVDELLAKRMAGKTIVTFHLRLRRLDAGYGGEHSYPRDSDFLEWYDFLRDAGERYPDIVFVALGRMQEKPLDLLRLPNVVSLRLFGMGLGHELTLMLRSSLFIGTSSGFAALANFSKIPYCVTKMNPSACHAYAIPQGMDRLPFALDNQRLIYEQETSALLMSLLTTGLNLTATPPRRSPRSDVAVDSATLNIDAWLATRAQRHHPAATTSRFFLDDDYRSEETGFLLLPALERARLEWAAGRIDEAVAIVRVLERNFVSICERLPEYLLLKGVLSLESSHCDAATERSALLRRIDSALINRPDFGLLRQCLVDSHEIRTLAAATETSRIELRERIAQMTFEVAAN